MRPFFSIGVTTYNRHQLLAHTLLSLVNQTFSDFEVIVGNDYTKEQLSSEALGIRDSRIRFVNYPENIGERANMNALLEMSRGKYFTWIADDDLYLPEFFQSVHDVLSKCDFPLCAFTSYGVLDGLTRIDKPDEFSWQVRLLSGREFLRMYFTSKLKAMGCCGVYEGGYLRRIGGVERLGSGPYALYSEYLLLVRAGLLDKLAHIDAPLILYRNHLESWGCSNREGDEYKLAGRQLIAKSIEVFKQPQLREDFRENLLGIWKLTAGNLAAKAPLCQEAHIDLAAMALSVGERDEALAAVNHALSLNPADTLALKLLARIHLDSERYSEVLGICTDILRREPGDTDASFLIAEAKRSGAVQNGTPLPIAPQRPALMELPRSWDLGDLRGKV